MPRSGGTNPARARCAGWILLNEHPTGRDDGGRLIVPAGDVQPRGGLTGVSFSLDRGKTWVQPTYQGLTAVGCDPTVEPCTPVVGPIHTAPNFYENGLRSRSDPGVASV